MPNGGNRRKPAAATTRKRPAARQAPSPSSAQPVNTPAAAVKRPAAAQPETYQDALGRSNAQPREMMELKKWKTQYTERVMGKPWVGTLKGLAWDAVAHEVTEQWKWEPEKGSKGTDKNKDKAT